MNRPERTKRNLPTIADLRALKGQRQLTMLRYFSLDEAAAAETAGIDIASVPADVLFDPRYRDIAPGIFSMTGHTHLEAGTKEDYLRWSGDAIERGADALYCSGSLATVEYLAKEYIPSSGMSVWFLHAPHGRVVSGLSAKRLIAR